MILTSDRKRVGNATALWIPSATGSSYSGPTIRGTAAKAIGAGVGSYSYAPADFDVAPVTGDTVLVFEAWRVDEKIGYQGDWDHRGGAPFVSIISTAAGGTGDPFRMMVCPMQAATGDTYSKTGITNCFGQASIAIAVTGCLQTYTPFPAMADTDGAFTNLARQAADSSPSTTGTTTPNLANDLFFLFAVNWGNASPGAPTSIPSGMTLTKELASSAFESKTLDVWSQGLATATATGTRTFSFSGGGTVSTAAALVRKA